MKTNIVLSFVILGIYSPLAPAQPPGTFTATGSMTTPRTAHTATLLPTGKVLVAGGWQRVLPSSVVASAELYDPSTGTFTATGSMTTPRAQHTATPLPDGRVLVAGGSTDLSAEIYDPGTGTFTATVDMEARPHSWLRTTTLLKDGRVFIAGKPTAQVYDPVTGTFVATGPYAGPAPTYLQTATVVPDGRVLLTGGDAAGWSELYDPISGTFSLACRMNFWSNVYTATLLTSGKVFFIGNAENDGFPADAELFDPADGAFTRVGQSAAGHAVAATALLPDGTVLITGGELPGGHGDLASELYVPATGTFFAVGNMIVARHSHTATLLPDGTVLIAGGFSLYPSSTSSAELYHPTVLVSAPLLFSLSGDGKGQAAIWHSATGQVVSPGMPAVAGEALSMYTTSLGDGSVIPPQVAIGGQLAEIVFFGRAPGYPGFNQVNVRVPGGIAPGSAVPVRLTYIGRPSNEVTMAVQ